LGVDGQEESCAQEVQKVVELVLEIELPRLLVNSHK
jgi:hypothetical protein